MGEPVHGSGKHNPNMLRPILAFGLIYATILVGGIIFLRRQRL